MTDIDANFYKTFKSTFHFPQRSLMKRTVNKTAIHVLYFCPLI